MKTTAQTQLHARASISYSYEVNGRRRFMCFVQFGEPGNITGHESTLVDVSASWWHKEGSIAEIYELAIKQAIQKRANDTQ